MRLSKVRRSSALGMNMTPMIDIVFLLIIFFMTVSQITQSVDHPVELPDVGKGGETLETINITINVDAQGTLIIGGSTFTLDDVVEATRQEFIRAGRDATYLSILVRIDRNCPGKPVNDLIVRMNQLGVTQIRLSVEGREQ